MASLLKGAVQLPVGDALIPWGCDVISGAGGVPELVPMLGTPTLVGYGIPRGWEGGETGRD